MLILGITILLVAIGAAVMPCWRHSATWGYGPGACVGAFLVCLGIFAFGGRGGPSEALSERLTGQPKGALMVEASIVDPIPMHVVSAIE
jgi:Protein of unknown function (DUF3309)